MPTEDRVHAAQAVWVVEQLLKDRRITPADVRQYLRELPDAVRAIEARLRMLRDEDSTPTAPSARSAPPKTRRHTAAGRLGLRFSGLIRHLPASVKRRLQHVRSTKGIRAAVSAAEQIVRKHG